MEFAKGGLPAIGNSMSNEFKSSRYPAVIFDGDLANDELNCSDFVDMVDWSSLGLNLLDQDLPGSEGHTTGSSLTPGNPSPDVHETQNGYVSELDISNVEADGAPPKQSNDTDTISEYFGKALLNVQSDNARYE